MKNKRQLQIVLYTNAAFSLLSGLIMVTANGYLSRMFHIESKLPFYLIGSGLIAFAALVSWTAKHKVDNRKQVLSISIADFIWVLASIIVIVTSAFEISINGYITIGIIAFIVFLFGMFQLKFNR